MKIVLKIEVVEIEDVTGSRAFYGQIIHSKANHPINESFKNEHEIVTHGRKEATLYECLEKLIEDAKRIRSC